MNTENAVTKNTWELAYMNVIKQARHVTRESISVKKEQDQTRHCQNMHGLGVKVGRLVNVKFKLLMDGGLHEWGDLCGLKGVWISVQARTFSRARGNYTPIT